MSTITRAADQLKSLVLPGSGGGSGVARISWLGATGVAAERRYGELVGDGSGSALVMACIGLIAAAFPEAPLAVRTVPKDGGVPQLLPQHPMLSVIRRPLWDPRRRQSWFSPAVLVAATLFSYWIDGNGYEVKVRGGGRQPVQRWYVPHWMLEPRWPSDGSQFISHYDYSPDGRSPTLIPVEDVIHYRMGIDPNNMRKGWSPVKTVLREVYTDEEAARFSAALLHNLGVPGLMLSPAKDSKRTLTEIEAKLVKADVEQKTTGDRRGETLVFTNPTDLKTFGFSPNDLNLSAIRNVPEERIAAVMRVPAAVVGFGSGLEGVKVGATMRELREQLWESNLLPTMRTFADELYGQLLPDFATDAELDAQEVFYDLRHVGALQELELKKAERWARLLAAGVAKRKEARAALGLPWTAEDDVYVPQPGVQANPTGDMEPKPDGATVAALVAGADELAKMRQEVAILAAKSGDGRPDPSILRLIEAGERAAAGRDATLLKGVLELAASLRPEPAPGQVVKLSDEVERDEHNRMLRIRPVYGVVESNGHVKKEGITVGSEP